MFQTNSFQAVLVTDGQLSFIFFSYGLIQWANYNANIGFKSGERFYMLPQALTPAVVDIEETSNVGVPGLYIYRVDQENITHPTPEDLNITLSASKPSPIVLGDYITLTCSHASGLTIGVECGDILIPRADDGSGDPVSLNTVPFPYFGTNETVIYVSCSTSNTTSPKY